MLRSVALFRLRKFLAAATRLTQFRCALAFVDDAGFLEKAAVAHFHENTVALHDLVEPAQRRLKRLIVFYCDTSHKKSPSFGLCLTVVLETAANYTGTNGCVNDTTT